MALLMEVRNDVDDTPVPIKQWGAAGPEQR